jgi:tetratricopeptide (TPR) repeat protein
MTMRKPLLIAAAIAVVAAGGAALLVSLHHREWTTSSRPALAEFQQGLQDEQKFFHREAAEHYARAAQLDPDFLAAKVRLVMSLRKEMQSEKAKPVIADLRSRDLTRVPPRERLLVQCLLAGEDYDSGRVAELLTAYLARYPADPFALELRCEQLWEQRDMAAAGTCYHRLIAADPNWIDAQNRLGYIAMIGGRFAEAEEQFKIYRYISPDQPNPHDSLGELLTLIGRWRDARGELEDALRIKPDFCPSWQHRVFLAVLEGDYEDADAVLSRAEDVKACASELAKARCEVAAWRAYDAGDWDAVLDEARTEACREKFDGVFVLSFYAALRGGRPAAAGAIEDRVVEATAKARAAGKPTPLLDYFEGVRLRLAGQPRQAVDKLRAADRALVYSPEVAYLKLVDRLELAQALAEAGEDAEAAKVRAEVTSVSPPFATRWHPAPAPAPAAGAAR